MQNLIPIKSPNKIDLANQLAEANFRLPYQESKLLLALIARMQQAGEETEYSFRVSELTELIGMSAERTFKDIDRITDNLCSTVAKMVDYDAEVFHKWLLVEEMQYKDGILSVRPSKRLKECIFQLTKEFTRVLIANVYRLRSMYAIRIYILLRQYSAVGKREMKIPDLKAKLVWPDGYRDFGVVRRLVIEPALLEIREKTDLTVFASYRKSGRSFVSVIFSWAEDKNPKMSQMELDLGEADHDQGIERLPALLKANGVKLSMSKLLSRSGLNTEEAVQVWEHLQPLVQGIAPLGRRGKFIVEFFIDIRHWLVGSAIVADAVSALFEQRNLS
jgi:plasmid replication initiation protein